MKNIQPLKDVRAFDFTFTTPLINGGGTCKNPEHVARLCKTDLGGIEIGSITIEMRPGNEGRTFHSPINSLGIPNLGSKKYRELLPGMIKTIHDAGKIAIVNIAATTDKYLDESVELYFLVFDAGADLVVYNAGCPNLWGNQGQKEILSYNNEKLREALLIIYHGQQKAFGITIAKNRFERTIVKISPEGNPMRLNALFKMLSELQVGGVVMSNTFPNGFAFDEELKAGIDPGGGLGGVSGEGMKPIVLGQIKQSDGLLSNDIVRIGAGGIRTGRDLLEYQLVGARLMQVATAYYETDDPTVFNNILAEYYELFED